MDALRATVAELQRDVEYESTARLKAEESVRTSAQASSGARSSSAAAASRESESVAAAPPPSRHLASTIEQKS